MTALLMVAAMIQGPPVAVARDQSLCLTWGTNVWVDCVPPADTVVHATDRDCRAWHGEGFESDGGTGCRAKPGRCPLCGAKGVVTAREAVAGIDIWRCPHDGILFTRPEE